MRFNHMELTFPRGALDEATRSSIDSFYGDVLGWHCTPYELFGQLGHLLLPDAGQFLLLMESDEPMASPGSTAVTRWMPSTTPARPSP